MPYPRTADCELLTIAFIHLLEKYVPHIRSQAEYIKLTLCFEMMLPNSYSFSYTLSHAIPLLDSKGGVIDLRAVYEKIYELVRIEAEKYQDSVIKSVKIRIDFHPQSIQSYEESKKMSHDEIKLVIQKIWDNCLEPGKIPDPKSLATLKSRIPKFVTTLKNRSQISRPFIVADMETLLLGEVHVPYLSLIHI